MGGLVPHYPPLPLFPVGVPGLCVGLPKRCPHNQHLPEMSAWRQAAFGGRSLPPSEIKNGGLRVKLTATARHGDLTELAMPRLPS
eukprot:14710347-Alexandrium_andersonii.AAC.1